MKIVYLVNEDFRNSIGVKNKIHSQIDEWTKNGCEVNLLNLHFDNIFFNNVFTRLLWLVFFNGLNLIRYVRIINKSDLLYSRYLFPSLIISLVFRRIKIIKVIEFNTDDVSEIYYRNKILGFINYNLRSVFINQFDAIVSVSPDFLKNEKNLQKFKTTIIGNPVLNLGSKSKIYGKECVFIGSSGQKWHGLDRIVNIFSLPEMPNLQILGSTKSKFQNEFPKVKISSNIVFHGYVDNDYCTEILSKSVIGISSFGLDRLGISIGSTLKTRQYLSHGLCVVSSHYDVDFSNDEFSNIYLRIDHNEFTEAAKSLKDCWLNRESKIKADMFSSLKNHSVKNKEKIRISFFRDLLCTRI
jgi:hypothetical protein